MDLGRKLFLASLLVGAMLVAAGCGEFGNRYDGKDDAKPVSTDQKATVTDKPFDAAARKKAGCEELKKDKDYGREHTDENVVYKLNPPTSGSHANRPGKAPVSWGIYDDTVPTEFWVHNLEHGHIVVAYKNLKAKEYDKLLSDVRRDAYHVVLLPRKANPKDGVYYLAWTAHIYCKKPSAEALQLILTDYRDQGPELFSMDEKKPGDGK